MIAGKDPQPLGQAIISLSVVGMDNIENCAFI
jgi:hypothetical protein